MAGAVGKALKQILDLTWRRRLVRYPLLLAGTLVGLFVLMLLVDRVIMPVAVHWGEASVIPDLTDLSLDEAKSVLEDRGLRLKVMAEAYDPARPPGTVLSQIPRPNSRVREGRFVRVTVSKGGETVLVPSLQGISMRQAELLLAHEGLELGDVSWVPSDSFPENVVIATTPSFDTPVPHGMSINLRVSLGARPDTVLVPDLLGTNLEESRRILREIGLQLGRMKSVVNDDFLPGTVLSQSLPSGLKVERGSEIELEVSTIE